MVTRSLYFNGLGRAIAGMSQHSDRLISQTGSRLDNLFHLLDIKTRAGDMPAIDFERSGLPVLPDVIRIENDIQTPPKGDPQLIKNIKNQMIDEMVGSKRMPTQQQICDVASAVYANEINHLKKEANENSFIVGTNSILVQDVHYTDEEGSIQKQLYSWDYWPAAKNYPSVTEMMIEYLDEDFAQAQDMYAKEASKIINKLSGTQHSILALAREIDRIRHGRTSELSRIQLRKFESIAMFASNEDTKNAFFNIENEKDAWALHFDVERLRSRGTIVKPSSILNPSSFRIEDAVALKPCGTALLFPTVFPS